MTTRTDPAKAAAIADYLARYEWHCEQEQVLVERGRYDEATRHHEAALQVLWSMDAEQQDPIPPGLRE